MALSKILMRRKWRLYAHGQSIVVVCGQRELFVHPLMKAYLWALYLPQYPKARIEIRIGDKYKPDVVAFGEASAVYQAPVPLFWGEAGQVKREKIQALVKRYPKTHFALGKWDTRLKPYVEMVSEALEGLERQAPFDLINFPDNSDSLVDEDGNIHIGFEHVEFIRLGAFN